jgi:hypothetical protein
MRKQSIYKIAALLVSVLLMTAFFCFNVSAANSMTLTVDSVTVPAGGTVDVPVRVTDNPGGLSTLIMSVSYDTAALELVSSANGQVLSSLTAGKNLVFNDGSG